MHRDFGLTPNNTDNIKSRKDRHLLIKYLPFCKCPK